jgi:predicted DNA-binding transcriptional regulator AlpA
MSQTSEQPEHSPWEAVPPTGPILRPAAAAEYIGLSLPTYYDQASRGLLPSPVKISGRASGVPRPWLDAVIADRVTNTGARL